MSADGSRIADASRRERNHMSRSSNGGTGNVISPRYHDFAVVSFLLARSFST